MMLIEETGIELWTRVLDTAEPRLEVLFRGEGRLDGIAFTSCWNTEVVPGPGATQRGVARGMLMLATGEFATWDEEGDCWTEPSGLVVAAGSVRFTQHGTGPLEQLLGRSGSFRFEQDADLRYRQTITLDG